ncbi:helix-turn-helix domain-containing protein [Nocardia farcinica]|uniref:helix-turn-helix domain-containing protein n=1 Tax=Nocardia farcinica TaxID=37329 RepID=UPI001893F865|nr:helix-turn-helix transcriptional regulator [Nocardia farcinica]MBF6139715.1 helix-turn-helix transcriptional regulator [Nocardia farcinica]MBF6382984.1 helix-turn-helix transcriptional regulator [Nocardia farcinica]MBF6538225.1 helix-turn-helix transcriptional regulator [Nocardia farcinica]
MRAADDARAALGARLRELRRAAHLSGVDLAARCGWHSSKISRIERGKQAPSEADLADWCAACDSLAVLDDLVASLRNLRAMYLEWQRTVAAGHAHRQRQFIKTEGETRLIRWYDPDTMPGLLQTEGYARAILRACISMIGGRDDLEEAVAMRMARKSVLTRAGHRFHILIGEAALCPTVGDNAVMVAQLEHLLGELTRPNLRLGVIPLDAEYRAPATNFVIYDSAQVLTETVSAELTITRPSEIALHEKTFAVLAEQAVYNDAARALIVRALERRTGAAK